MKLLWSLDVTGLNGPLKKTCCAIPQKYNKNAKPKKDISEETTRHDFDVKILLYFD